MQPLAEKYESTKLDVDPSTRSLYTSTWKYGPEILPLAYDNFGVPVSFTSNAIVHAITARFPLVRYRISWVTYLVTEVTNRLPTLVEDAVFYKLLS